eukprot:Tbor_TRINITY_DN2708_c0_g1::TRINITY_DN2708_c0_g1_i3::g.15179::m.15179/K00993/EPT1; ethanolaminephosphotransferase
MQARRIGAANSLGELVDHGCDAVTTVLVQYTLNSAIFRGKYNKSQATNLLIFYGFFMAIWEQYCTSAFVLDFVNGPTEGLLLASTTLCITGVYGTSMWNNPSLYPNQLRINNILFVDEFDIVTWGDLMFVMALVIGITTVSSNIIRCIRNFLKYEEGATRYFKLWKFFLNSAVPLTFAAMLFGYVSWALRSIPGEISQNSYFLLDGAFGFVCAGAATRITVARITSSIFSPKFVSFVVFTVVTCVITVLYLWKTLDHQTIGGSRKYEWVLEPKTLWPILGILFIICVVDYAVYCLLLFQTLASHLGIYICSLTDSQKTHVEKIRLKKI